MAPIEAREINRTCLVGSYSKAWHMGHAILEAKKRKQNPAMAVLDHIKDSHLISVGKVRYER
jgi:DUF917 family protein